MRRQGPERQHTRVCVDAFVRVLGDQHQYALRIRDLSRGGLFLYTRVGHAYPFQIGASLDVELYDFDKAVKFRALVVRVVEPDSSEAERYPSGFGVRIVDIDAANQASLDELIQRAHSGDDPY